VFSVSAQPNPTQGVARVVITCVEGGKGTMSENQGREGKEGEVEMGHKRSKNVPFRNLTFNRNSLLLNPTF
jgi:hypothetical protein